MTVTDVYLWDETVDPRDIVLRTTAAATTTAPVGGGTRPRLRHEQHPPPPGTGHLHIEVNLHGQGRVRSRTGLHILLHGTGEFVPADETARRAERRSDDELLALLLDMPELFP